MEFTQEQISEIILRLKLSDFQSLAIMACKRLLYRSKFTHLGKHDLIFCPTREICPIPLGFHVLFGNKTQRSAVDTIA